MANKKLNTNITLEKLNEGRQNSMQGYLDIEFTAIGPDFLTAKMPIEDKVRQPFGILHGGASVALAETVGSVASMLCIDDISKQYPVGLEINANHVRPIPAGVVYGTARPLHIGRKTHVWDIKIVNEAEQLICISRLTVMIVNKEK